MRKSHIARGRWPMAVCFISVLLLVISYLPLATSHQQLALASDSTPSANIQSKLKALQEEIASRAAEMKNEVSKKLLNKSYIGVIANKDTGSLTVSLRSNTGNINVSEFTEYIIKSKTYEGDDGFKKLSVSDPIAALGDIDDKGALNAKRIIKLAKPIVFKKILHGNITSVATSSAILKTIQSDEFTINFDKNTDYQIGRSEGTFKNIKVNQLIIVIAENQQPAFLAKFVYIFP